MNTVENASVRLRRLPARIEPDSRRVVAQYFQFATGQRLRDILRRFFALEPEDRRRAHGETMHLFAQRHRGLPEFLERHVHRLEEHLLAIGSIDLAVRVRELPREDWLLLGAFFTCESAFAAAAVFNPSIIVHPLQQDAMPRRVLLSMRTVGDGHASSIAFRSATMGSDATIDLDPVPPGANAPLADGTDGEGLRWFRWQDGTTIDERMLPPMEPWAAKGFEDARFVHMDSTSGTNAYVATCTAFDGKVGMPYLLHTDFFRIGIQPMLGSAARGKGFALFPNRIDGEYVMIGRQDGETLTVMRSNRLDRWDKAAAIHTPSAPWELIQSGNCGSPIETDAGWLVLTHGVGAMRRYCLGALLLDHRRPERVIGRLRLPLMEPAESDREGYVPNVVYTCGALLHAGQLVIPYGQSDRCIGFAVADERALLKALTDAGP